MAVERTVEALTDRYQEAAETDPGRKSLLITRICQKMWADDLFFRCVSEYALAADTALIDTGTTEKALPRKKVSFDEMLRNYHRAAGAGHGK